MKCGGRLCCSRSPTASQIDRLVLRSICSLKLRFKAGHGVCSDKSMRFKLRRDNAMAAEMVSARPGGHVK